MLGVRSSLTKAQVTPKRRVGVGLPLSFSRLALASCLFFAANFIATKAVAIAGGPNVSATKSASFPGNNDSSARPGDTITYTGTIQNSGTADAAGVQFADTIDPNSTFVANSTKLSPNAVSHPYNAAGNTQLIVAAGSGLKVGVVDLDGVTPAGSLVVTAGTFGTSAGGSVTIAADGSFTYTPQTGDQNLTDTFSYTVTDGDNLSSTGLVSINLGARVWYVDSAYTGANGPEDGSSAKPFNSLADISGATGPDAANDIIFIRNSGSTYDGNLTLLTGQLLYGSGANLTVNTIVINTAGTNTSLGTTAASTNSITLGNTNTVTGFTIDNTTGAKIIGTSFGTLTISNVTLQGTGQDLSLNTGTVNGTIDSLSSSSSASAVSLTAIAGTLTITTGAISGASGDDFFISAGTGTISYGGTITNSSAHSVSVQNKTGGSVTFSGAITDTAGSTGINLFSNTGATITFRGGLNLTTTTNAAFTATTGGTVNVCSTVDCAAGTAVSNTLSTTTGTALNVANTTIGASNLNFQSISANGAAKGIILNTTGTGGLIVTGTGTIAGSGGTIQNTTTRGIEMIGPAAVASQSFISLKNMNLTNNAQSVQDNTTNHAGAGTVGGVVDVSGDNINVSAAIHLNNVNGATFDNININGSNQDGINGLNVVNLQILNSTVQNCGNEPDETGVYIQNLSGLNCKISNSTFSNNFYDQFAFVNFASGTLGNAANPFNVSGSTFIGTGDTTTTGGGGFYGRLGGTGTGYVSIGGGANSPSTFRKIYTYGAFLDVGDNAGAGTSGSATFIVNGNQFGTGGAANYNNSGIGTSITHNSTLTYDFSNNTIIGVAGGLSNGVGITVTSGQTTAGASIIGTITNNTIGDTNISGSGGFNNNAAITLYANGGGDMVYKATVTGNHIFNPTAIGIQYIGGTITGAVTGTLHITGNDIHTDNVGPPAGSPVGQAIAVAAAASGPGGSVSTLCADIGNGGANTITGTWDGANGDAIRVTTLRGSIFTVGGMPGTGTATVAEVTAYVSSQNGNAPTSGSNTASGGGTFVKNNSSVCPLLFAQGGISAEEIFAPLPNFDASQFLPVRVSIPAADVEATAVAPVTDSRSAHSDSVAPARQTNQAISQSELDSIVAAAIDRWSATGLTPEQVATLRAIKFEVVDLPGIYLGEADANRIRVSSNAGGNGWFIDASAQSDAFFGKNRSTSRGYSDPASAPAGHIDLLTSIMHEMGHALGLPDSYEEKDRDSLMYGFLTKGERRLPKMGEAIGAIPGSMTGSHFLGLPAPSPGVTLNPGTTITVQFQATINAGFGGNITNTGTVSGNNFSSVNTNTTTVPVHFPPTITSGASATFQVGTNGTFTVTTTGFPAASIARGGVALPSGVSFTSNGNGTGTLTGTPAAGTGGTYAITFTASNSAGTTLAQSFTLTVNEAPTITSGNATTFVVGTAGTFTVTTGSHFPAAETVSKTGALPSGVTFVDNGDGTATLSGTPDAGTGGSYPITITAANGIAPDATQSFTLTVKQPPAITSANATTFVVGSVGTFTVTTTGTLPMTLGEAGALPSGVNFLDNGNGTATLSGIPAAGTGGTYNLSFTASNGALPNANQNFNGE